MTAHASSIYHRNLEAYNPHRQLLQYPQLNSYLERDKSNVLEQLGNFFYRFPMKLASHCARVIRVILCRKLQDHSADWEECKTTVIVQQKTTEWTRMQYKCKLHGVVQSLFLSLGTVIGLLHDPQRLDSFFAGIPAGNELLHKETVNLIQPR